MSNQPPDSGKARRPAPGTLPSFDNPPTRALLPIMPDSSLAEIIAQMKASGAEAIELLVPDGTRALQSVAGCDALGQAAAKAGVHITLFTSDEKTTTAANLAKLDLITVGGAVAAPKPSTPTRSLSPARPASPPQSAAQTVASPPVNGPQGQASTARSTRASGPTAPPPAQPSDADFLAGLAVFDQPASSATPPPRLMESDQGAMLFDTPGDAGVRRPPTDDTNWEAAFGAMGATMAAEPEQPATLPSRSRARAKTPAASLARRASGTTGQRDTAAPPDEDALHAQRSDRTPAEADQRRRQRLNFIIAPLGLLGLIVLLVGGYWLIKHFAPGAQGPTLQLTPPPNTAAAVTFPGIVIPFSDQPITGTNSIAIQGRLLTAPVSVTVPGTAETAASTPLGLATGTITLRNTTSQPIDIQAGTQLQANGITFTFNRKVTVPPAITTPDGISFGRAEASLTATTPGGQGNLPPNSIKSIPGLEGALRVEQGPFAGGTNQEVKIVRVEDVNRVLPQAMSQLYATGVQALQLKAAEVPGWELPAATITPTLEVLQRLEGIQYTVLPPIGSVASDGNFTVEVRSQFRAIASTTTTGRLDEQLARVARTQLLSTRNIDPKSTVTVQSRTFRDQNLVVDASVQPPNQAPRFPSGFLAKAQAQLAGKSRAEAEQYLSQLVSEHQIARAPTLPADWQTVPANVQLVQAP